MTALMAVVISFNTFEDTDPVFLKKRFVDTDLIWNVSMADGFISLFSLSGSILTSHMAPWKRSFHSVMGTITFSGKIPIASSFMITAGRFFLISTPTVGLKFIYFPYFSLSLRKSSPSKSVKPVNSLSVVYSGISSLAFWAIWVFRWLVFNSLINRRPLKNIQFRSLRLSGQGQGRRKFQPKEYIEYFADWNLSLTQKSGR